MSKEKIQSIVEKALYFLFVTGLFLAYIKISRLGAGQASSLIQLLNGTADRPFIYRIFIPQSVKLLAKITPFSISLENTQITILKDVFLRLDGRILQKEAFWVLVIIFVAMLGFIYVEKRFLADLGFSQEAQQVLPLLLLTLTLPFTVHFGYLYDMPQLFLFTVSLWLLSQRKWGWYLFFFFLTTLNK